MYALARRQSAAFLYFIYFFLPYGKRYSHIYIYIIQVLYLIYMYIWVLRYIPRARRRRRLLFGSAVILFVYFLLTLSVSFSLR